MEARILHVLAPAGRYPGRPASSADGDAEAATPSGGVEACRVLDAWQWERLFVAGCHM